MLLYLSAFRATAQLYPVQVTTVFIPSTQITQLKKVKLFTKLRKTNKLTGKLDEIQQISKVADNGGIQKAKEVLQGKVDSSLTWYNKLPQGLKNDIGDPSSELGR